ncbi:hypothetical protein [Novipirellula galeiformis]|nr:hypothetical protein [Novipirellula galeiformis]
MNRKSRQQLYAYQGNCCHSCGLNIFEVIERYGTIKRRFEFHHVAPAQKAPNYHNLIRRVISTDQLDELDKCVLLCDQCHNIVHAQNIQMRMEIEVRVADRSCRQTFVGQAIVDAKEHSITFLTNERPTVIPYRLVVARQSQTLVFGSELSNEALLPELIAELPSSAEFSIYEWKSGRRVFMGRHLDHENCELTQSICCDFMQWDLFGETPEDRVAWLRNGFMLTRDGGVTAEGSITATTKYKTSPSDRC